MFKAYSPVQVDIANEKGVPSPAELDEMYRLICEQGEEARLAYLEESLATYQKTEQLMIPFMPLQLSSAVNNCGMDGRNEFHFLDLGCGTGLAPYLMLDVYPNARLTLMDMSFYMLDLARLSLKDIDKSKVEFTQLDYVEDDIGEGYDYIHCGYSLSYLEDDVKHGVLKKIYDALKPGGLMALRDVMPDENEQVGKRYRHSFGKYLAGNGLDPDQIMDIYYELMYPMSYQAHLAALEQAGFEEISTDVKIMHFCNLSARKPG